MTPEARSAATAVPEGWRTVRLGEVFEQIVNTGHTADLPVLSVTLDRGVVHRSSLARKMEREVERRQYLRVQPGDIAYNTMRMWQGGSGLVRDEGYLSPAYTVCRARPEEDPEFWALAFKSAAMIRAFRAHSQGFAKDRYRLYFHHFATVPALRPPLAEQRKIAAILASMEDSIDKSRRAIECQGMLKRALLGRLFEDGSSKGRFNRLDSVAYVQTGVAKGKPPVGHSLEVPYLRVANVQDGYLDLREVKTIRVAPDVLDRYSLREGDVLFTEGGDADKLGRGCVWQGQITPCLHQNHIFAVRVDRELLLPEYLSYFGSSRAGRDYFLSCSKQTTNLASINSSQLRAMPVPIPPLDEQHKVVAAIGSIEMFSKSDYAVQKNLLAIKATLSTALLSHQIRVTPDEAQS